MDIDTFKSPNTKQVLLDGLRQALQAKIGHIWTTVTVPNEPDPAARFREGVGKAVKHYEMAWRAIKDMDCD